MPHLKTENFYIKNEAGIDEKITVKINVDKGGLFSSNIDEKFNLSIKDTFKLWGYARAKDMMKVSHSDLDTLVYMLKQVFKKHYDPEISEEYVIIYNIESHVSFAEDNHGNIFPNGGFPNAEWRNNDGRYGNHHASKPSNGGYSIIIGARAMIKITYKYGDSKKVKYKPYYKGGSHLGHDNPAQLLNSWCSFSLNDFKEMPYSDESAIFFHNLMLGMAKISQMIQNATFEEDNLMKLIASGNNLFLPNHKTINKL